MAIGAVITGDIVNSTRLGAAKEKKLFRELEKILLPDQFEFYRGDSFQVYQQNAGAALTTALLCRTAAIRISTDAEQASSDVRISIGIGRVKAPVKTLGIAKGEAFILSGRAFDELATTNTRLIIATVNRLANAGLRVIADYTNSILKGMTVKQATVIYELLNRHTQQEIAEKLGRSKSTINQHVSSGRWVEIEKLLGQYESIINQIS